MRGIRCGVCWNEQTAFWNRAHNDGNVLSIGQRTVDLAGALAYRLLPGAFHIVAFWNNRDAKEHVAVVPGNAFGPGGDGFTRMCYATEYSKIEEALHRMEKFMNRYG